jgi:putative ABC transport system ATP-binding protein
MTEASGTAPLLRLEEVTRRYPGYAGSPSFALQCANLDVPPGGWIVLTGRSGAGKTTLLNLLAGLDRPDSGRVWMFGQDLSDCSEAAMARVRRKRLGIVYQRFFFIEHLPVWQNVSCRLVPDGIKPDERRRRAQRLLEQVDLSGAANRRPRDLSGGEQQRVAVARALVGDPDVLIADEPTSNVDARTGEMLVSYFKRLQQRGTALVIATHDPALVEQAWTHYLIERGSIRQA